MKAEKESNKIYYAHTSPSPDKKWHTLEEHLLGTGELAAQKASKFGAGKWGRLIGEKHDFGKGSCGFQDYLLDCSQNKSSKKVDHSTAGAQFCERNIKNGLGIIPAHCIAGHHSGLLNAYAGDSNLDKRLAKEIENWEDGVPDFLKKIPEFSEKDLPSWIRSKSTENPVFSLSFWCRMLFSCLIDADRQDTIAAVWGPRKRTEYPSLEELLPSLNSYIEKCAANSSSSRTVNQARNQVLGDCRAKASILPGLFTLTVPTGGGKTLSGLSFALEHARVHNKSKVIYVAPYTAIIDQTAKVYREALGGFNSVLEHHSNVSPEGKFQFRLAAENWEHPVIATTSVQFLESLFTNHPSRSRKLHNIVNSIIILDEAQTIPARLIAPTLRALEELIKGYGCTIVLCTATQPALEKSEHFKVGLTKNPTEISSNPVNLFHSLKRTEILDRGKLSNDSLIEELKDKEQVLCIVNTKKHAQDLYRGIPSEHKHHLSAAMCPKHRIGVLEEIKYKLDQGKPVIVVSTSVMEAGVDIDFPEVYRALAGLDSINQSAGRCNRGGKLDVGKVNLFRTEGVKGEGYVKKNIQITEQVLELFQPEKLLFPEATKRYFELYFHRDNDTKSGLGKDILKCFKPGTIKERPLTFDFLDASNKYRIMDQEQRQVLIPWDDKGMSLANRLISINNEDNPDARKIQGLLTKAQLYIVNVYPLKFETLRENNPELTFMFNDELCILPSLDPWYDSKMGLIIEKEEND